MGLTTVLSVFIGNATPQHYYLNAWMWFKVAERLQWVRLQSARSSRSCGYIALLRESWTRTGRDLVGYPDRAAISAKLCSRRRLPVP